MPKLRLKESDRKRLGCPEFLPIDTYAVTNKEAVALAAQGFPTPNSWRRGLELREVDGEQALDVRAWTSLVWLALRRSGIEVEYADLEFGVEEVEYISDPPPVEPTAKPGKAPARGRSRTSVRKSSTSTAT